MVPYISASGVRDWKTPMRVKTPQIWYHIFWRVTLFFHRLMPSFDPKSLFWVKNFFILKIWYHISSHRVQILDSKNCSSMVPFSIFIENLIKMVPNI